MVHSFHIVAFHIAQDFGNAKANQRKEYYKRTGFPSSIYDGGYNFTYHTDESKINASGIRQTHMLEMSLSKSIEGSTLSFSGSVTNLDSHSFSGFVLVFITENQLVDETYRVTWNFVFRDYGLNKTLSLAEGTTNTFSGIWNVPSDVNAANIQVFAAAYDADAREPTYGWPYAVQSVCDVCDHSVAVPEFPDLWIFLFIVTSTSMTIVLFARKKG